MLRYYELLSHISIDELDNLKEGLRTNKIHPKKAKESLAFEIVERYWGRDAAVKAKEEFEHIFRDKELPEEIPLFRLGKDEKEIWLPRIMKQSGMVKSTGEGIRLIKQGAVSVNREKWIDPDKNLPAGEYILKVGKRRFLRILPEV
jgi:tyrosyl-tRNA synthetase